MTICHILKTINQNRFVKTPIHLVTTLLLRLDRCVCVYHFVGSLKRYIHGIGKARDFHIFTRNWKFEKRTQLSNGWFLIGSFRFLRHFCCFFSLASTGVTVSKIYGNACESGYSNELITISTENEHILRKMVGILLLQLHKTEKLAFQPIGKCFKWVFPHFFSEKKNQYPSKHEIPLKWIEEKNIKTSILSK